MKTLLKTSLLATTAVLLATSVAAQQMKPEDMMRTRQGVMMTMAWNMGKIKAQVEGPADKFDKTLTANAALVVKAVANSGLGMLFGPGTDKPIGDVKTRVKPELFDPANKEELGRIASNLAQNANKLAEVAAGGDQAAIKVQFGEIGKVCKACHDQFRNDEKK